MALSPAEKRAVALATREAAWNMIDDLKHIRDVIAKPVPMRTDIRHVSNLVRRLLIDNDGDLRRIAPPRLPKQIEFLAPDVHRAMKERERAPAFLDSVGVSGIFGTTFERITVPLPGLPYPPDMPHLPLRFDPQAKGFSFEVTSWKGEGEDAPRTVSLKQDKFLSQVVLFFEGKWISRRDIIKYIANVAGGVHSTKPTETSENLLHKIRQVGGLSSETGRGIVAFTMNQGAFPGHGHVPVAENRIVVDFVFIQLLAAARYVTISPDIIALEEIIRTEDDRQPPPATRGK